MVTVIAETQLKSGIDEQAVAAADADQFADRIISGDALTLSSRLASDSINLITTSPPFYGCRNYGGGRNELGREWHPLAYVENLILHTIEWRRILAPDGNLYLNLGDVYFGSKGFSRNKGKHARKTDHHYESHNKVRSEGCSVQDKQLLQLPSKVSIRMAELGWILRNEIIWTKPNPVPAHANDRRLPVHEKIFHFVKGRNYFDLATAKRLGSHRDHTMHGIEAYKKHQATFPETLIVPLVLTSSRPGDLVFDPFMGSGTVAVVAKRCGRHWLGFELVEEFCRDANRRVETTEVVPYSDEELIKKNGIKPCASHSLLKTSAPSDQEQLWCVS
jgi:site-specific DNA-methyltransferase (cytosine-N4-specific)